MGEFTNMTSFSVKPPNVNCTFSSGGSSATTGAAGLESGDGNSEVGSTVKVGCEEDVSPSASAVSDRAVAGDAA